MYNSITLENGTMLNSTNLDLIKNTMSRIYYNIKNPPIRNHLYKKTI